METARVFIGSSSEQKTIVSSLKSALDKASRGSAVPLETDVWYRQFKPSWLILESLEQALSNSDYGVFIFSPDDIVSSRGKKQPAIRDNVLFEFGLWMGRYGRGRSLVLAPETPGIRVPSDLLALNCIRYSPPQDLDSIGEWERQLTGPAIEILQAVQTEEASQHDRSSHTDVELPAVVSGITTAYRSVADARHDIIREIRLLGGASNSDGMQVRIIGHRLREIWSVLYEVFDGAVSDINPIPIRNVRFSVYHTDPDFLENLQPPHVLSAERGSGFVRLMSGYADVIRSNVEKLQAYNDNPRLREAGLSCETVAVRSLPGICAYILGDQTVFLGRFLWDMETGDFGVRRTSCFRIERGHGPADRIIEWCLNQAQQHDAWRM